MRTFLFFVLLLFPLCPAYADCSGPAGEEGVIIYNADYKVMQFCNGTDWISMAGAGHETVKTMTNGWPDAIQCTIYNHEYNVNDTLIFYATYMPYGHSGLFFYRTLEDIGAAYATTTTMALTQIGFNSDQTFNLIHSSRTSGANPDIHVYTDAGSCDGKSIADLYAEGNAFNFLSGNGG
ncbi:MAG: hypothetical protein LRY54_04715 [Alphaproteobacteria bacterium]|nr:hypothetical protein [Alphaproteobacteria bacterium]